MSQESQREKRELRLRLLEDDIGRHLQQAQASGELRAAPSFGKPLDFGDGYAQTPAELRMGMKILKDAGVVPAEVEAMQQIAALQQQLDSLPPGEDARALAQRIAEKRQALALRLEQLRINGSW
jgi:hypothetical protein